jgi:hypothetical protein
MGELPLDPKVRKGGGKGVPLMVAEPHSPLGEVFNNVAEAIAGQVSVATAASMGALPFKPGPGFTPLS